MTNPPPVASVPYPGLHIEVPTYHPLKKHESELGADKMYHMNALGFNKRDVKTTYRGITGPLALFAPYPHEDIAEAPNDVVELDRPVTPITEEIKHPPPTFAKLSKLVRRRITSRPEVEHLSKEDQQALAAVIMGEVNAIWPDFKQQVSDPFLSVEENKELQRRITVHIVTVCERLFYHYVQKAQVLNKRGVFSGPANTSRLKAQLALDAHKFLHILTIRRYIVGDMRHGNKTGSSSQYMDVPRQPTPPALSFKGFVEASRPKSSRRRKFTSAEESIKQLQNQMPALDTGKLLDIISDMPQARPPSHITDDGSIMSASSLAEVSFASQNMMKKAGQVKERRTSEDYSREKVILKRAVSASRLPRRDASMEELTADARGRDSALSLMDPELMHTDRRLEQEADQESVSSKPLSVAGDLERLVARNIQQDSIAQEVDDDDLPPLIQALTRSAKHDGKAEVLKAQLKELEQREKQRIEAESITIQQPHHPQPATVAAKLSNKLVVKASDIRVSERVCLSSITLRKYATVYNDLTDEIDADMVKKLDNNLFLGDEIKEVYSEIMKTVPNDHLGLAEDKLIEVTADNVNLTAAMASSTLSGRRKDRIINPSLQHDIQPPWGELDVKDWAKTPVSPPMDLHGRQLLDPMIPAGNLDPVADVSGQRQPEETPPHLQDFMARSYASWLMWWKNTINSDDYMKYLSTQETDYMGVVFHFYNSDEDEDDDEEDNRTTKAKKLAEKQAVIEEREKKITTLRKQKEEYKDGFWNANSILLGGLGKDPVFDVEELAVPPTPTVSDAAPSLKTARSKTQVTQRKSTRSLPVLSEGEVADNTLKVREAQSRSQAAMTPAVTMRSQMFLSSKSGASMKSDAVAKAQDPEVKSQDRLERVWAALHMPDSYKLDMAIKYSSDQYHTMLPEAIQTWEKGAELIIQREHLIAKLEQFERLASDPNRFFEKGPRGSSVARLEEAKLRSSYYKKIEQLDVRTKTVLEDIQNRLGDTVTFQGRPYLDKMKWDRVEMLYWLQEERKQQALDREALGQQMALSQIQLEPLVLTPSISSAKVA